MAQQSKQELAELLLPNGKSINLPVVTGTENEKAIDISNLRSESGYITLDSSYANTGSCISKITYINGEEGILRYCGYPIEELAEHSTFLETSYLLIYGELPNKEELKKWVQNITRHTLIHEDMKRFFDGFPKDGHPMAILSSVVSALNTFYQNWDNPRDHHQQSLGIVRLMAKLPTLAAFSYKKSIGQPFIYPDNSLTYSANFLKMMFATPAEAYVVDDEIAQIFDLLLILHADHEQNCSTSTVRLVGSSLSTLYASIAAGIGSLWGPRHGGANERVIEMLESIVKGGLKVKDYVERAKNKDDQVKLMGFGHRVYKNYDPRAKILKSACDKVLKKLPLKDPLFDVARELEEIALNDPYFVERKLYPNVDYYSGIIYRALGIPVSSFTPMFALGRIPGWIAQWRELINTPDMRIGRPRQIYIGANKRKYPSADKK